MIGSKINLMRDLSLFFSYKNNITTSINNKIFVISLKLNSPDQYLNSTMRGILPNENHCPNKMITTNNSE